MTSLILILWLASDGFASGNYQKKSYSAPPVRSSSSRSSPAPSRSFSAPSASAPKSNGSSSASYVVGPQARDMKTIERDILRWDRQGVAIHGVSANEQKFMVKGAYTFKSDFERFLKKLKGEDEGPVREVSVKESSSSFGGSTSYEFEAEVENAW